MHSDRAQRLLPYQIAPKVEGDHDVGQAGPSASGREPSGPNVKLHLELELGRALPADRGNLEAARCTAKYGQPTSNDATVVAATVTAIVDASLQSLHVDPGRRIKAADAVELEHAPQAVDLGGRGEQCSRCPLLAVDELGLLHATAPAAKSGHDSNEAWLVGCYTGQSSCKCIQKFVR